MDITPEYWAGLFDGEGRIVVAKDFTHIFVSVTQKELPILYLLKARYGGTITNYKNQTCGKWLIHGCEKTVRFLSDIEPYAIIKRKEIIIALELFKGWMQGDYNKGYNGGKKLKPEELERRTRLRNQLQEERKKEYQVKEYPFMVA